MNLTPGQRKQIDARMKREDAYHEAGHAAIQWMFGHWLEFIDMRGNRTNRAFVRHKPLWGGPVHRAEDMDETTRHIYRLGYQREMMNLLAGYAAQSRVDDELWGDDWFDFMLDCGEWEFNEAEDINRAVSVAKGFYGDNGNAWRFLYRMASWTDEALNHPQLWAVVEALSERLQAVTTRISGGRVVDIMAKAWPDANLPFMEMGRQWRRRFALTTGKKGR